ncbi:MAG TPA: 50S ribosomal protein L4 [Candidatus Aenigmarchaeota archaeon]|nr:50S ribosomal protein L4 [Candidatus Aenigmarchaeota archaeon]
MTASSKKDIVLARGHKIHCIKHIPLVLEDRFQELKRIKDVKNVLDRLGLKEEIERTKRKKIRSGKGTSRGRRYKKKKGPLIIVKEDKGISHGARNLPGVEVVELKNLDVEKLAPGAKPGRLCIWTQSALSELEKLKIAGEA